MEGIRLRSKGFIHFWIMLCFGLSMLSCASKTLEYDKADQLKKIDEFDSSVKIILPEDKLDEKPPNSESSKLVPPVAKKARKKISKQNVAKEVKPTRRQPEIESDLGFDGRRPLKDPFRIGEKMVHDVSYLGMTAGSLTLEVKPFAEVNGKRSYNFRTGIKTSSLFNSFYSVDDFVTTLVDYETLVPSVFSLHVKESAQLKEARMLNDVGNHFATYWEKKVSKKSGEEEKKLKWDVLPFSQNVFSAIFYLRNFQWDVGTENAFRVADNEKNLVFKAKAIRKEKLKTDIGEFDSIVIRPEVQLEGKFQQTGENYIWLSDDDRKFILRIESKIKIGSLTSEIVHLDKGSN